MKTLRTLFVLLALCGAAFAWPACSGQWVSVPKGTTGGVLYSTGDLLFQCQPKTVPPTPTSTSSSSNATSNSTANASSSASATATQKQNQSQGQTQTATGGDANANAANNGNNSNNSVTNVEASKIPVATAYAPTTIPTVTCFKGVGVGVQTMAVGGSFGGGKIDENCAILETARAFDAAGQRLAACKVKISNKYAKKAGVTLQDCLAATIPPPVVIPPQPVPASLPVIVTVVLPPSLPSPIEYRTAVDVVAPRPRSCTLTHGTVRAKVKQYRPCPAGN